MTTVPADSRYPNGGMHLGVIPTARLLPAELSPRCSPTSKGGPWSGKLVDVLVNALPYDLLPGRPQRQLEKNFRADIDDVRACANGEHAHRPLCIPYKGNVVLKTFVLAFEFFHPRNIVRGDFRGTTRDVKETVQSG